PSSPLHLHLHLHLPLPPKPWLATRTPTRSHHITALHSTSQHSTSGGQVPLRGGRAEQSRAGQGRCVHPSLPSFMVRLPLLDASLSPEGFSPSHTFSS